MNQRGGRSSTSNQRRRAPRAPKTRAGTPAGLEGPWVSLRSATNHPFIYQRMIREADRAARPGDVVNVYIKDGELLGRGLYNPQSQIAIRMLTHGEAWVDEAFWRDAIARAVALRDLTRISETTDAYRLVHAEGDGLSGLIVERYADVLVMELFSLGMAMRVRTITDALTNVLSPPTSLDRPQETFDHWRVLSRADARVCEMEGFELPETPEPDLSVVIRENGLRFRVKPASGHKTGFFCDQRDNRRRLAALCGGKSVLDLCCYTGGFSVAARVLGEASEVIGVDLDEDAVAVARENANLNQARIKFTHADSFKYLRQMAEGERRFDVIALDPPKFCLSRNDYEDAMKKYLDLNRLAMSVVAPDGVLLTCSCSGLVSRDAFLQVVHRAGRQAGRIVQVFDTTGPGADHPVRLNCPESGYLKAVWARVG
ncbi:MAG: class I SAM-dependent rRNA methyltransferase [Phycisphaerales bacterium]|nr:class I SAM-dependent rRNA methyltransferase [Phycisphaerales bacterium]